VDRDLARIAVVLGLLEEVWRAHPDQRLGQLLLNYGYPQVRRPNPIDRPEDDLLGQALSDHLRLLADNPQG
jgi:hypothetical protein